VKQYVGGEDGCVRLCVTVVEDDESVIALTEQYGGDGWVDGDVIYISLTSIPALIQALQEVTP
jgi:hypothetical protein